MELLLRKSNLQARRDGKPERHKDDDFSVLDGEVIVGWISRGWHYGNFNRQGWNWSINTYGHTPDKDSGGFEGDLEAAKAAFKARYVQIRRQILEWASTYVDHVWKQ